MSESTREEMVEYIQQEWMLGCETNFGKPCEDCIGYQKCLRILQAIRKLILGENNEDHK